jgi:hypothetical protein
MLYVLGVSKNLGRIPEHEKERRENELVLLSTQMTLKEIKNLLKTAQTSKVVSPFTRALAPPFIGR